jgi:hypothetical protein
MPGQKNFGGGVGDSKSAKVHSPLLAIIAERKEVEAEMDRVWSTSGGVVNTPHSELNIIHDGYMRQYTDGGMGRIYAQHDAHGWHGFLVYGAIGQKYNELGGPDSWLGWPTSGEMPFDEGGRVSTFEHGAIYWWPDTGPIELNQVLVRYSGLHCFGETADQFPSTADEPYVIFGVVSVAAPAEHPPIRTQVYEDVDAKESRGDDIEIYRGLPYGLIVSSILMEHDFGNPDEYRDAVKGSVAAASAAVVAALANVPYAGPALSLVAGAALAKGAEAIVDAINKLLDTGDDLIGQVQLVITPKEMIKLTRAQPQNFDGILWHLDSPLISGDGASYKAYFTIQAA